MIWYEVVEDLGDGSITTRRFRTFEEAEKYETENLEWCYYGIDEVNTDDPNYFFYKEDKCE